MEMLGAIQTLLREPSFRELLLRQNAETQKLFTDLAKAMAEGHPVLIEVRNDIGGHVHETSFR